MACSICATVRVVAVDGAFAVAAGDVERHVVDESAEVALLPVSGGVAVELLLSEAERRLDAVAALPVPVSPYRERVVPAAGAEAAGPAAERREIIAHATGRRSARDIAFAVGRSLYPVTVEISLMLGEGLLAIAPPATSFALSRWGLAGSRGPVTTRWTRTVRGPLAGLSGAERKLDHDALAAELRKLRENIAGVTDTVIAASDGIPILADVAKNVEPAHISALAAADLGIARQASEVIGLGALSQTVVFGRKGYMAVHAIGRLSLMVVLGDKGLNLERLLHEFRPSVSRWSTTTAGCRWAPAAAVTG